ncbi:MAG: hypothetical protein OXH96_12665 [Spirochaetaceae bacterium]|nr:hypothetical protein [Spirochaetaceae bacterium]
MVERQFDFELTPFGGAPVEHVKVAAINRGFAFSRAVARASDPNNIRKAKLVRDEGRELDPHNPNESRVPLGHESFGSDRYVDRAGRLYSVDISLFGDAGAIETVDVLGRVNVFTAAAFESTTPDAVVEVRLLMVQDTSGQHAHEFDPQQRRGGVTIDLHDPVVPLVIPAHEFRP